MVVSVLTCCVPMSDFNQSYDGPESSTESSDSGEFSSWVRETTVLLQLPIKFYLDFEIEDQSSATEQTGSPLILVPDSTSAEDYKGCGHSRDRGASLGHTSSRGRGRSRGRGSS